VQKSLRHSFVGATGLSAIASNELNTLLNK